MNVKFENILVQKLFCSGWIGLYESNSISWAGERRITLEIDQNDPSKNGATNNPCPYSEYSGIISFVATIAYIWDQIRGLILTIVACSTMNSQWLAAPSLISSRPYRVYPKKPDTWTLSPLVFFFFFTYLKLCLAFATHTSSGWKLLIFV